MTHTLDPRIGVLASGRFYAFVNGYNQPEFTGTLTEVEAALGLRTMQSPPLVQRNRKARGEALDWDVQLTFEYPAWDEREGIWYRDVPARCKSEANAAARRQARGDGHVCSGKGRIFLKAFPANREHRYDD